MKAKIFSVLLAVLIGVGFTARSDEGMWLPNKIKKLNYADMQKLGCKLSAEDIYDINNSSMKDAIFQLLGEGGGGFCTGEMVSDQGLMLTNHHCAYMSIAQLSSTENDYLTDGFWAMDKKQELPVEGLSVSRVVRIEDVTETVLEGITDDTEESDRSSKISKAIKKIEKEAEEGHYKARVKEMFKGGEYYLFVYEVFGDVRLVGAPPSSIGKFGGDTDNWMWPRHTGDFAMFRVYMAPDGTPTKEYSEDNVPYKPLHFLPVSIKGVKENDFTMIMGFPGETDRYLSSYGMEFKRDFFNPILVKLLDTKLKVMKADMDASDEIRIALSDGYASLANGWKLFDGEATTLRKTDAIPTKYQLEEKFQEWVGNDDARKKKYGEVVGNLKSAYAELGPIFKSLVYASFGLMQGTSQIMVAQNFNGLHSALKDKKNKASVIESSTKQMLESLDSYFEEYFMETDKKVFLAELLVYYNDIEPEKRAKVFEEVIFKYKADTDEGKIKAFVEAVYEKSIFVNKTKLKAFLDKPNAKVLDKDPIMLFTSSLLGELMMSQGSYVSLNNKLEINERLFIEGLREMQTDKVFYPDANSTLRLTYGTVRPYKPRDAVQYSYITYIDGIIEKMDNSDNEFKVDKKLVQLWEQKDYGDYADETGNLPVAFLSDNDITGGNSGSPIINGNGELIGLAFDGNWEWLCSNLLFSEELQRTINVDVRYVLWVIDKFAGAGHLVDEMTIVK